jgi:hypothetical protein
LENIKQWTKVAKLLSPPNCKTKTLVGSREQEKLIAKYSKYKGDVYISIETFVHYKDIILRHAQYKTLMLSGLGMDLCLFLMP